MKEIHIVHPFPPVYDENSSVLILGSFPSVVSRKMNFYYANHNNRFWPVLSALFHEEIIDREDFCHRHHIALWDVIHSCRITGSSDTSIKDVTVNDIGSLVKKTQISCIFTTGKKASSLYDRYIHLDHMEHIGLPSTSSANASMHLEDLIQAYAVIPEKLNEKEN